MSGIFQYTDYRDFLRGLLTERIRKNPSYSLRSLARQLQLSPGQLSLVLRGERHLSHETGFKICTQLGLGDDETRFFALLIQYGTASAERAKREALNRIEAARKGFFTKELSLDTFQCIADWYHIPILEMTELPQDQFTPAKIARRLGIREAEARDAIDRLVRLKLIEFKEGCYKRTYELGMFESESAHAGLRAFHTKMLEKAAYALQSQSPRERVVGSETFALDPNQLDEIRKLSRKYLGQVVSCASKGERYTEVYHVGIQVFRLA